MSRWLGWLLLALGSVTASAESPADISGALPIRVGLEVVAADGLELLEGKRIGLVVHAASLTHQGDHTIDVLRRRGYNVSRLFSPEHGLRGRAEAGEAVASGRDSATGLPVVSLYGKQQQPTAEQLADLDVLVFDLQGAGVRFYTYVSTMILCLEAAAAADLDFVVLDRPNPLGGERIEGPVSAPREVVPSSFVNLAPGPLVHGLTMGEMARLVNRKNNASSVNSERSLGTRLTVVPMKGWRRSMTWRETGRTWVAPSPNLRSPEAAMAYPGVALLEATNASEGRGTEAPFLLFGAPWLGRGAAPVAPGFKLHATNFVPSKGAKNGGRSCQGWRVEVIDAASARPYRLGLELLTRLSQQEGFEWLRGGDALTWLLGTPKVYAALTAGRSVDETVALDHEAHRAWRLQRRPALLYD